MAKFLKHTAGRITEEAAVSTSAGAGDAAKLPELNGSGVLDASIVNSKTSSAGAGDSGKVVALDGSGRIDSSMMPVGIGADTKTFVASEALSAGDFVNIWDDTGTAKARKTDATTSGKEADGFVLAAFASGATATVYFEGTNTQLTALTGGTRQYLSTTPGACTATAPSGSGNVVQYVGKAVSATELSFEADAATAIILA